MPPESKQKACLKLIKDIIMQYTKPPRLLRLSELIKITCLSKSTIYKFMAAGAFPKSISLGSRSVAWLDVEIQEWIQNRIENREKMVS